MKIVKVTYTTKAEFSSQNQTNIKIVMADLKKANHPGIHYQACISPDQKTFIHTAFFKSDEDQKILNDLPSFRFFQEVDKPGRFVSLSQSNLPGFIERLITTYF